MEKESLFNLVKVQYDEGVSYVAEGEAPFLNGAKFRFEIFYPMAGVSGVNDADFDAKVGFVTTLSALAGTNLLPFAAKGGIMALRRVANAVREAKNGDPENINALTRNPEGDATQNALAFFADNLTNGDER